jgi:hypothetical protein
MGRKLPLADRQNQRPLTGVAESLPNGREGRKAAASLRALEAELQVSGLAS